MFSLDQVEEDKCRDVFNAHCASQGMLLDSAECHQAYEYFRFGLGVGLSVAGRKADAQIRRIRWSDKYPEFEGYYWFLDRQERLRMVHVKYNGMQYVGMPVEKGRMYRPVWKMLGRWSVRIPEPTTF